MLCVSVYWTYIIVLQIHARLQCHLSILYDPHPQSGCKICLFVDPVLELSAKSFFFLIKRSYIHTPRNNWVKSSMEDVDLVIPDVLHGINAASVRQAKSLLIDGFIWRQAGIEVWSSCECPNTRDLNKPLNWLSTLCSSYWFWESNMKLSCHHCAGGESADTNSWRVDDKVVKNFIS